MTSAEYTHTSLPMSINLVQMTLLNHGIRFQLDSVLSTLNTLSRLDTLPNSDIEFF